jgi:hypothetical protein
MSKRIMQENLEQCLQLSEQELDSVVGGAVPQKSPIGSRNKGSFSPPLPRPGGGVAASTAEEAAAAAALIAGFLV